MLGRVVKKAGGAFRRLPDGRVAAGKRLIIQIVAVLLA